MNSGIFTTIYDSRIYNKAKSLARPIAQHRRLLERVKYLGEQILSPQEGNDLIASLIHQPAAIGRIGGAEMGGLRRYFRGADSRGLCESWGHDGTKLHRTVGLYPPEGSVFSKFCDMFTQELAHLDASAVWFNWREHSTLRRFAPKATLMMPEAVEPYLHDRPWSQHLAGKRVLVVNPFTESIEAQYRRRRQVWRAKPEVLPDFELRTIRCPLHAALVTPKFPDWFAALDAMRKEMASAPFDVTIVGAAGWSVPLVVHAKSLGACGIYLGGPTQLLFGIEGRRWDSHPIISTFYNEAWTRPSPNETPQGIQKIEGGCYW